MAETAPPNAPRRARDVARAALVAEITSTARAHLVDHGAAGLSLRAVSRDLGMASSALYRYFPSRDALLTALIIEAYDALGDACTEAHDAIAPGDLLGRWRTVAHAARAWARANPHEYALIYGSPVPGYAAPADTIDPATRVPVLLLGLLRDIEAAGAPSPARLGQGATQTPAEIPIQSPIQIPQGLAEQLDVLQAASGATGGGIDHTRLLQGLAGWVLLFGMLNFELFGQFANVFDDADALFAAQVDLIARRIGLDPSLPTV